MITNRLRAVSTAAESGRAEDVLGGQADEDEESCVEARARGRVERLGELQLTRRVRVTRHHSSQRKALHSSSREQGEHKGRDPGAPRRLPFFFSSSLEAASEAKEKRNLC